MTTTEMKKPKKIAKTKETVEDSRARLLDDRTHVRLRPGMYIPNKDYCIYELVDNGVDILINDKNSHLYKNKLITLTINEAGEVIVTDNAGGMPIQPSIDLPECSEAELCLSRLKAGTKFEEGVKSAGLNGVGASCINFLSSSFKVKIFKNGKEYYMEFIDGEVHQKLTEVKDCAKSKHGTHIHCVPDAEIWADKDDFNIAAINNRMKQLCYLNPELTIKVDIDYSGHSIHETYSFPEGVKAYIEDLTKNSEIIHEPWHLEKKNVLIKTKETKDKDGNSVQEEITCDISVAFVYTESYSDTVYAFTNNVLNTDSKSSNITGFKRGLAASIKEMYEEYNPKSKITLQAEDTREGVIAVVSLKVPDPDYIGQGKDCISMPKVASALYGSVKEYVDEQLDKLPSERDNIFDRVVQANKVREAAHKAKETARKTKGLSRRVEKLAKCTSKNPEECEIFLVEGDSAAGTAKGAREDAKTMAILPVFGKIPNVEDLTLTSVLSSEKLVDIINALECGIGEDFNIENLRYHKIVILADADVDGYHIATLYITFFYRFMRPLLENGHVYLSCPPLYKVVVNPKSKKPVVKYAITDEDLNEIIEEIGDKPYETTYIKGLGEMSAEQLWESTMSPETRTLIQVRVDDIELADETIIKCMNKNAVASRKELIMSDEELSLI